MSILFKIPFLLIVTICAVLYLLHTNCYIDIALQTTMNPVLFYPFSLAFLILIKNFAFFITKFNFKIKFYKYFICISKYTFEIMCLHILVFKLIDYVYINCFSKNYPIINLFPFSYQKLFIIYLFFGLIVPILFMKSIEQLKKYNKILFKR